MGPAMDRPASAQGRTNTFVEPWHRGLYFGFISGSVNRGGVVSFIVIGAIQCHWCKVVFKLV